MIPTAQLGQFGRSIAQSSASSPYWGNTVLQLHFDGANNATTTTDSSSYARTVTFGGTGMKIDSTQSKFGGTALNASTGATSASVYVVDAVEMNLGSSKFTIECWVYFTSAPANTRTIFAQRGASGQRGWHLGFFSGTTFGFRYTTNGSTDVGIEASWTPTLNQWYHIAVDRDASNVFRVYIDGVVHASATASVTIFNSTNIIEVGSCISAFGALQAYIDELRMIVGDCVYGGAFTPPTAAFPNS